MPNQEKKENRSGENKHQEGKPQDKPQIERRFYQIELRAVGDSPKDPRRIIGHFAVFNVETDMYWFREKIAPGAFAKSIQGDDIRALWNHDPNYILGRNLAKTLTLTEDSKGLLADILPPDTQFSRDLQVSIDRGDVSQGSFGFEVIKESWEFRDKELDLRTLEEVKLWDVSPVTFPAYQNTDVALRSQAEWKRKTFSTIYRVPILKRRLNLLALSMKNEKSGWF